MKPLNYSKFLFFLFVMLMSANLWAQQTTPPQVVLPYHKPPSLNQISDTIWRATFTYDLNTLTYVQPPPYMHSYSGSEVVISNFRIHEQIGNLKALLAKLQFEAENGPNGLYDINPFEEYKPQTKFTKKEKDSILNQVSSLNSDPEASFYAFKGMILAQEWLYDAKTQKIIVHTPSAAIIIQRDPRINPYDTSKYAAPFGFKFSARSNDSLDFNQLLFKPEIVWGRLFTLPNLWANDSIYHGIDTTFSVGLKSMALTKYVTFYNTLEDWIFDAVKKGKLEAYKYKGHSNDAGPKLKKKELDTTLTRLILICDTCGKPERTNIEYQDLAGLKIVQEIIYNQNTEKFESKIVRVALLMKAFDVSGDEIPGGTLVPLVWVKFD